MKKLMYLLHLCWALPALSVMMLACSSEDIIENNDDVTPPEEDVTPPEGDDVGTPGIVDGPDELTVYLDFKAGWPFNEPCAEASAQTKDGEPYTYSFAYDSNGQTKTTNLDFMISHGTVNTSIDYSYSDGALRFNSTGGNNGEIKLPGIEGYYLSRVDARHISAERSRFALKDYFIAKTESLNERFLDGWASSGVLTMFWMPVTEGLAEKQQPGQSFTLEMRDKNMAVSEIKLVYTKTKPTGAPALDLNGRHLYAHRGKWSKEGSDYFIPENSLTGIQMAALMGYEGIECDVKYTKDKVMVVMHDATINKSMRNADYTEISSDVKVADLTFDELRNNYVLESTEPAFRLQCPTLEEMLLECKRCGMRPMLHSSIYESYELAQKIMGDDWVCFTGANFENVLKVRSELKSKCTILWSISSGFDTIETELVKIGGDCGISSMESGYYSKEMIDRLRNGGYHVQCSIFPSGDEHLAIENGVDYILTDRVIPMGARTDITAAEILAAYPPPPSAQDLLPDEFTVSIDFTKGWPFVEPCVAEADQDTGNGDVYTYKYSYTSSEGTAQVEDFKFVLYARAADNAYSYDASKPSDGLYAGPAIGNGNYSLQIEVPGVSKRYFKSIRFTSPDVTSGQWTLSKGVNTGGTANVSSSYKGDFTWNFPYTSQAGTPVEIGMGVPCVVRARRANGRLYTLDITYTKTKPE